MNDVRCVWDGRARLGEGPVWNEEERALYWVDIERPGILRFVPDEGLTDEYPMPERIGCVALREQGGLVAAMQSGFCFVDLASGQLQPVADPEGDLPNNRFNDGKCDTKGRLWAGTMDMAMARPTGSLYRLDPDGSVHRMDRGYIVTNGPEFSPDGTVLYHNDSLTHRVFAFDCDPETGAIDNKRLFARTTKEEGFPDGMAVDSDGCIWLAHWGGSRVTRLTPDGDVDRVVQMPASQVTSCAFGGDDLRTLYVTTARIGLKEADLAEQPLAGGVFAIDVDVAGLPTRRFGG